MPNINRFISAQASRPSYQDALQEISNGRKTSHWIWYIFPQLAGFGSSKADKTYGIADLNEACEYLQEPSLVKNYLTITGKVLESLNKEISIEELMDTPIDVKKLLSSLTLFQKAAEKLLASDPLNQDLNLLKSYCEKIFALGYPQCQLTLQKLNCFYEQLDLNKTASAYDVSDLKIKLEKYISTRKNEWDFHYNFLGIVYLFYWLQDRLTGTNHLDIKSKNIKLDAAEKLMLLISNTSEEITFTASEEKALHEGRLGVIFRQFQSIKDKEISVPQQNFK